MTVGYRFRNIKPKIGNKSIGRMVPYIPEHISKALFLFVKAPQFAEHGRKWMQVDRF